MEAPSHRVAEFRQRPFTTEKPKDMNYGMCVGFSAQWILRHRTHKSEGPKERCANMKTQSAVDAAETIQRAYLNGRTAQDTVAATGQKGALNAGFKAGQSAAEIQETHSAQILPETLKDALGTIAVHSSGIHKYFLFMLSFGRDPLNCSSDNHVIAGYHSGGKLRGWGSHLYVFEPNFGEFKLSGSEIRTFFSELRTSYLGYTNKSNVLVPQKLQVVTIHKVLVP